MQKTGTGGVPTPEKSLSRDPTAASAARQREGTAGPRASSIRFAVRARRSDP